MTVKPKRRRKTATEYSGGGDAVRSLELLWGVRKRPSRGPKPGLSLDRIVRAAIELADGEGFSALSMQRVAAALGFTTMSLYRYVPSKAELLDLMLDTVARELPLVDDVPGGWRAKLEASALADWALYHRHPWFLHVTPVRPVMGPNGMAVYDAELRAVSGIGLTDREVLDVVHLVDGYVRGAARLSVDAAEAEQETGVTDEQWWSERTYFWDRLFDPARLPTMARMMRSGAFDEHPFVEAGFLFGLQRVLDGIEALVRSRSGQCDESGETSRPTAQARDESADDVSRRGEGPTCAQCGGAIAQPATGRPRAYCSRACQQRAYRARSASEGR
ncbi:TetR family transcriptional regulator [Sorangium cellulosum]|uniref:TetR family transcriptional regulator n=1 Tax=Sorangium cellulosum TaxID=56 RepID=A0A2L0EKV4_SORCE|nr:TetR/AcrR family transcriptional regulator [Sorangium cellulosum]AUX39925.1 TetR family transcriptional regulator [Sorangium cellulosum]